jgi:hypothetical protein
MIKILYSRNRLPFSQLICWATKKPVSHVVVVFDDRIVYHSNPMGVHLNSYPWFLKHNTVVYEKRIERSLEEEEAAYLAITLIEGSLYDFGSIIYYGCRLILLGLFGKPLPKKNLWASGKAYSCVEVLGELPPWIWPDSKPPGNPLATYEPYELAKYMGATA